MSSSTRSGQSNSYRLTVRVGGLIVAFAVVVALLPSLAGASSAEAADDPSPVIVQLENRAAATKLSAADAGGLTAAERAALEQRQKRLRAQHRATADMIRENGIAIDRGRDFTLLFNGFAAQVSAGQADRIERMPRIEKVWRDRQVRTRDVSPNLEAISAAELWEHEGPDGEPVRGAGTTVAVVDTGVDYTHPALGGDFGSGHKVVVGHDFVNEDGDPRDDNGHGTHVAGIVAGDGDDMTGVAPEATLAAYKVLDRFGNGRLSDVMAGLQAAVDPDNPHRADIVNMSLGAQGNGRGPLGQAASAAVRAGTVVVASAGNDGPGARTVGTPAAARGVLAVGASTTGIRVPQARVVAPEQESMHVRRMDFSANPPADPVTGELADAGTGSPEELDELGDIDGKVLLMDLNYPAVNLAHAREAQERGAAAVVFHVNEPPRPEGEGRSTSKDAGENAGVRARPDTPPHSGDDGRLDRLVAMRTDGTQERALQRLLSGDEPVRIEITGRDATDEMASFSSRGPTWLYRAKPNLVAPGVEIRSTVPGGSDGSGEQRLSGTSMAAPHAAGAAALVTQLAPDRDARARAAALAGTADALDGYAPSTQGAGRLDVRAAADADVTPWPMALSFGLAELDGSGEALSASTTLTLTNASEESADIEISSTAYGAASHEISLSPAEATVPAGGSTKVTVDITAPQGEGPPGARNARNLSGWITIDAPGENADTRVPYLLAVRPLTVRVSPDPSAGHTQVFLRAPGPLNGQPQLNLTGPDGERRQVSVRHDHDRWWRASLDVDDTGVYRLAASGRASAALGGVRLAGAGRFEVVSGEQRGHDRSAWQPVGPNGDAGPIVSTPKDPDTLATNLGHAAPFISTDRGATWDQATSLPVAGGGGGQLVIDPTDSSRLWYALRGVTGNDPTYVGKILRSTDRGRTWAALDFPDVAVDELVVGSQGRTLVAFTDAALYLSHDGGDTWTSREVPWGNVTGAAIIDGDLYAATFDGLWTLPDVLGQPGEARRALQPDGASWLVDIASTGDVLVTATRGGTIYGSRDGGESWTRLHRIEDDSYFSVVGVDTAGDRVFVSSTAGDRVSSDGGRTWSEFAQPDPETYTTGFDQWPGGPGASGEEQLAVAAAGSGIYATSDGGQSYQRRGVQGVTIHNLTITGEASGSPLLVAGSEWGTYETEPPPNRITPQSREWGTANEAHVGASVPLVAPAASDPSTVWKVRNAGGDTFWVYRSRDGGRSWDAVTRSYETPTALLVHPRDPDRVYIGFSSLDGSGLYRTSDGGETWHKEFHGTAFTALAVNPADPGTLLLGSDDGLYRSRDDGRSVTKLADGPVTAIGVDRRVPERIVLGGRDLRVSTDGGQTFSEGDSGGLPVTIADVVTSPRHPEVLYAASNRFRANGLIKGGRGVFRSTDGGRTWVNVSGGLDNTDVTSLTYGQDGKWLYAGTVNGGVHRLRVPK